MSIAFEKFPGDETFPVLLDESDVPDFWVNMYLVVERRSNNKFNTLRNAARNLDHLRAFERITGRNFAEEFARAKFLTNSDIKDLRNHCWLRWQAYDDFLSSKKKVGRLADPFSARGPSAPPRVEAAYASARMADIQKFLVFVAETALRRRLHEPKIRAAIDRMKRQLEAARPDFNKHSDPFMSAPEPTIFLRALNFVDPKSSTNPWRPSVRKRNSLMFKILISTGIRLGELLCLRTDSRHLDLSSEHPEIRIRKMRLSNEPTDPRRRPPRQKTTERTLLISQALASEIEDYINTERRMVLPARKHNFLFVSQRRGKHWGAPLSYSGWETIIDALRKSEPELYEEVRAHGFRHAYAYFFNKRIDEHNTMARANPNLGLIVIDDKNREKNLMEVMGWTNPKSAEPYLRRYVKEKVDHIRLELIDELSKFIYVPGCEVTE